MLCAVYRLAQAILTCSECLTAHYTHGGGRIPGEIMVARIQQRVTCAVLLATFPMPYTRARCNLSVVLLLVLGLLGHDCVDWHLIV